MLSIQGKADCLNTGIFSDLDESVRMIISERMGEREFQAGDILFLEGEQGDELFIIVSGEIEIYSADTIIAVLGAGEVLGEMAVLGGGLRTASGRAKDTAKLLFLKGKAVKLLIQQIPDLALMLFKILIERLESANELILFLNRKRKALATVNIVEGDLAGQVLLIYQEETVVGRSRGSIIADGLRLALPTEDKNLLEQHFIIKIAHGSCFVEPMEGEVSIDGVQLEESVEVKPEVQIKASSLTFSIKSR